VSEKLTEGLPVRILLETTVTQEGEVFKHSFDEMGRIVLMNDNYYLRYKESKAEGEGVATMIKISSSDEVQITRHGETKTRLTFNGDADTYSNYKTPQGILEMRIQTTHMSLSYNEQPFAGEVDVDYTIYVQDVPLGTYQLRLRFTT
jgi:uncharacterized beta-barrel protein YwiB (DUF1934 family)